MAPIVAPSAATDSRMALDPVPTSAADRSPVTSRWVANTVQPSQLASDTVSPAPTGAAGGGVVVGAGGAGCGAAAAREVAAGGAVEAASAGWVASLTDDGEPSSAADGSLETTTAADDSGAADDAPVVTRSGTVTTMVGPATAGPADEEALLVAELVSGVARVPVPQPLRTTTPTTTTQAALRRRRALPDAGGRCTGSKDRALTRLLRRGAHPAPPRGTHRNPRGRRERHGTRRCRRPHRPGSS